MPSKISSSNGKKLSLVGLLVVQYFNSCTSERPYCFSCRTIYSTLEAKKTTNHTSFGLWGNFYMTFVYKDMHVINCYISYWPEYLYRNRLKFVLRIKSDYQTKFFYSIELCGRTFKTVHAFMCSKSALCWWDVSLWGHSDVEKNKSNRLGIRKIYDLSLCCNCSEFCFDLF